MFWISWQSLGRVVAVGILAYAGLVVLQRVSGKRTLSKLNAFDLIVTVAIGSALATTMLSRDTPLADGLAALGTLIVLQLVVTFLSVRFGRFQRLVKASPTRLMRDGEMLRDVMRKHRVAEDEVRQAVRASGSPSLDGKDVVLETNGKLSVVPYDEAGSAMKDVR